MAAAVVGLRHGVRDHYSAYIERPDPACGRGYAGWGYKDLNPSLTEVLHHADCVCRLALCLCARHTHSVARIHSLTHDCALVRAPAHEPQHASHACTSIIASQ
jgi:hypothetical protein